MMRYKEMIKNKSLVEYDFKNPSRIQPDENTRLKEGVQTNFKIQSRIQPEENTRLKEGVQTKLKIHREAKNDNYK